MKPFRAKYLLNSISDIEFLYSGSVSIESLVNIGRQCLKAAKMEFEPLQFTSPIFFFASKLLCFVVIALAKSPAILRFSSDAFGRTIPSQFSTGVHL